MTYGITTEGFSRKPFSEIVADIKARLLANVSPSLNLAEDSALGTIVGILASKTSEGWELAEAVYSAAYLNSGSGAQLDSVVSLTGVTRLPATKSTVTVTCTGTNGTVLPAGRIVSVVGTGAKFVSLAEATISGGTATVEFEAQETGEVVANAGTLTQIETPVSGWTAATNPLDAERGNEIETDAALRLRHLALLPRLGNARTDAVRARVLALDDVEQVFVFENVEAITVDGIPTHSIEVLVMGGEDDEIAAAIQASKPHGIKAFGVEGPFTVTDSQGFDHSVSFTRPTEKAVKLNIVLVTDDDYPEDGDDRVKEALVSWVEALTMGDDVYRLKLADIIFNISGVVNITTLQLAFVPDGFGTADLSIAAREIATLDTSNITVSSS